MPSIRTSPRDQLALAVDDLVAVATRTAKLSISPMGADRVAVELAGSEPWHAKVHARASISAREARMLVATEAQGDHIIVADQIAADAKQLLDDAPSWSWLDRRSELHLRRGDATLEILLPPGGLHPEPGLSMALAAPASDSPIRGRAGMSYAAAVLLSGHEQPPSIRSVARQVGMAASTVSDAAAHLRAAGLVRPNGHAQLPDLFWALVAVWRPLRANPVATRPTPDGVVRLSPHLDDLTEEGWAQGGDEAALAWGALMFLAGSQPWIWVPSPVIARRAERQLGPTTWEHANAVIAVPPTPLVCMHRLRAPSQTLEWPTPHPLYLALDLARDPSRGREILEGWSSPLLDPRPWAPAA